MGVRKSLQISVRQSGGLFGGERSLAVGADGLHVTEDGVAVTQRKLTREERARVRDVARRLMAHEPAPPAPPDFPGDSEAETAAQFPPSDAMLTEVEIDDASGAHRYRVQSGDDAPQELWELVGTLGEVAQSEPPEPSPT